jgi:hypothetical protein
MHLTRAGHAQVSSLWCLDFIRCWWIFLIDGSSDS